MNADANDIGPDAAAITVRLNGEPLACPAGHTLAELVARQGAQPQALATAVNGAFVPRAARAATTLREADEVTFIVPIVGG